MIYTQYILPTCSCFDRIHLSPHLCINRMHYLYPTAGDTLNIRSNELAGYDMYMKQGTCTCGDQNLKTKKENKMNNDKLTWIDTKVTPVPENHKGLVLVGGSTLFLLCMLQKFDGYYGTFFFNDMTDTEAFDELFSVESVTHWLPELPLPNKEGE
jgi:hypothetical protein